MNEADDTADLPLRSDKVGLLEGLTTTRAIRRYTTEAISSRDVRDMLFAATRAPSGSNRQPFRFVVLSDGPLARRAKGLIGEAARRIWADKRLRDGYDSGSGTKPESRKARSAAALGRYVESFEEVPLLVLACLVRYRPASPSEGASVYPACQNLLLAARALGYGGVLTGFHHPVEGELKSLLGIPEQVSIAAAITIGRPEGGHGPVRRLPLADLVFEEHWGAAPSWAVDPPGTRHTAGGPPRHP